MKIKKIHAKNSQSIIEMFGLIAARYDFLNFFLSAGLHREWKKKMIRAAKIQQNNICLDCATGTGDIAFLIEQHQEKKGQIFAIDFCEPMLKIARQKAHYLRSNIQFIQADILNLPFSMDQFDIVTISFGLRNVANLKQAIYQLQHVLKPQGKLIILEFGQPDNPYLKKIYKFYAKNILPRLGGWISHNMAAYQYLYESSWEFPYGSKLINLLQETNYFKTLSFEKLQNGITYLYTLEKK